MMSDDFDACKFKYLIMIVSTEYQDLNAFLGIASICWERTILLADGRRL